MMKFAIHSYLPRRYQGRASFEEQDICRRILAFKDGRNVYSRWAAHQFATALSAVHMSDAAIVCIPASTQCSNVRRWKLFSKVLCQLTGAQNGFDHIEVRGRRKRAHVTGVYELATDIEQYVHIDEDYFRDRKVVVIDDIYTTGQSSRAFIEAMEQAGATVVMAGFLAKTRQFGVR